MMPNHQKFQAQILTPTSGQDGYHLTPRVQKEMQRTLLNARLKQFFAEGRSPFFQMQLPKHNQASARDGFNLTWTKKVLISQKLTSS